MVNNSQWQEKASIMAQGLLSPDDMMMQYAPSDVGLLSLPVDEGSRGMILPLATRGGEITAAMPQFLVDMGRAISAPYRAYTGELGDPMEEAFNVASNITGGGLLAGLPERVAAAEAGQTMLGMGGGNPFYKVSDADYQAILRGAENTRRTQLSPTEVVNADGTITRTAPATGLLADENYAYGPFTKDRTNPLDVAVTYKQTGPTPTAKIIKPSDLEGEYVLNMPSDRTVANRRIVDINGVPVDIDAMGGYQFPLIQSDVWASEPGVVTGMKNAVLGDPAKEGRDVFGVSSIMGPKSNDYSHHISDGILSALNSSKILKKDIAAFDKEMKKLYEDWPGIKSEKIRDYLMKPGNGSRRKAMANVMSKAYYKDKGFPDIVPIRVGTSADELAYLTHDITGQANVTGMSIAKLDPEAKVSTSDAHITYKGRFPKASDAPEGMAYEYAIPRILEFPDFFAAKRAEGKNPMQDRRAFEITPILQKQRPEVVDNKEIYLDMIKRGLLY